MSDGIKRFFDSLPMNVVVSYVRQEPASVEVDELADRTVIVVSYSEPSYGFGDFAFVQTEEGLFLDTETSGPDRVKKYLEYLVDNAILDTDQDPESHLLYNKVMGRICGEHCKICHKGP